jgi:uncharacterized membrane protein
MTSCNLNMLDQDEPFFSARLTPYRSLARGGYIALMVAVAGTSFIAGFMFLKIGAWPVFGFLGLDVLLVYLALRHSYLQGKAFEDIDVSPVEIRIRRTDRHGEMRESALNPAWARLVITRIPGEGVTGLSLVSHGKSHVIGDFLNPADRESFADALSRALASARRGRPLAEFSAS